MAVKSLKRNIFQRLFGVCATRPPLDASCWHVQDGHLVINLEKAAELNEMGGSIRLNGETLREKLLVFKGDDGKFHAVKNQCGHGGRRVDYAPGENVIKCCSVGCSTYDYEGKVLSGPATKGLTIYPVQVEDTEIIIDIAATSQAQE